MNKQSSPKTNLPWHLAGSLSPEEEQSLRTWLDDNPDGVDELKRYERLKLHVASQAANRPAPEVHQQLINRIHAERETSKILQRLSWVWGVGMALAVFLIFWGWLQPGVVMGWTVQPGDWDTFRIYRAAAASGEYALLDEIPAEPGFINYRYIDLGTLPGMHYHYQIEGIQQDGRVTLSQPVQGNSIETLPMWLAMLLISVCLGVAAGWVIGRIDRWGPLVAPA